MYTPTATPIDITLPLTPERARALRAGDMLRFSGPVFAARDAAHRRMAAALAAGEPLPVDLRGATIYYVGPTTAMRMDPFTPALLSTGLLGMIGKGDRGPDTRAAIQQHGAIYCIAVGGAGALLSGHIRRSEVIAYEDLGTEAIRRLELDAFPAIVACDATGGNIFDAGKAAYRRSDRASHP